MKISKLFHWLYAFLMFLPVTFLLPSLLYFGFNDNATAQEYTKEEPIYYETNDVTSVSDLVPNRYYTFSLSEFESNNTLQIIFLGEYHLIQGNLIYNGIFGSYGVSPYLRSGGGSYSSVLLATAEDGATTDVYYELLNNGVIDFLFVSSQDLTSFVNCISACPRSYVASYQEVTYTMGITESINQSILDTFDLPMFSWTSDNFIIAPFNYITNLFGLPNGNVVNKYLDYWLSISIIYLCFDVIMYVPLLVHRWLDKGIVE